MTLNETAAWIAGALFVAMVSIPQADARTTPDLPATEPQGRQIGGYVVNVAEQPHDWCFTFWVKDVILDGKCIER